MKKYILFVFALLFSCSTDKTPLDVKLIDSQLFYKWISAQNEIQFKKDGTFVQKFFDFGRDGNSDKETSFVVNGEYKVTDNIIELQKFDFTFIDPQSGGISYLPFNFEYEILSDTLIAKTVEILTNVQGSGTELWGKWTMTRWSCHFVKNNSEIIKYAGREKYYYEFIKDSANVSFGWEYLEDSPWEPSNFDSEFTYEPPYLDLICPSYYDVYVKFSDKKMYWYHSTIKYSKESNQ